MQADADVDARVLEIESMGVALRAVADDGYLLALDEREIGVVVVVRLGHCFLVLSVDFCYGNGKGGVLMR